MTDITALKALRDAVENEDNPDFLILGVSAMMLATYADRGETDAAIALCRSVLPGWDWNISHAGAWIEKWQEDDKPDFYRDGEPARALLLCVLDGMIWEAGQ
jgi:hypothetical protein